ncbi:putative porin [Candidatus Margulisiibacteriota bacterium]
MWYKKTICFLSIVFFLLSQVALIQAEEIDSLLKKLVDKKVISSLEAKAIKNKNKADVAIVMKDDKSNSLPAWVKKMKFTGDFRLRYQHDNKIFENKTKNRFRIRARLGAAARVNEKTTVSMGFCSGSDDPRSSNQSLEDGFSTKAINLDYAYAAYKIFPDLTAYAGKIKIKKALWRVSDLIWDGDINPEGFSALYRKDNLFVRSGYFVLGNADYNTKLAGMFYAQPGFKFKINGTQKLKASLNLYMFQALSDPFKGSANTNSYNGQNKFAYDYDSAGFSFDYGIKNPLNGLPYISVFADYLTNFSENVPDDQKDGYLLGIKFGDKKIKKANQWQAKVMYRHLEKNACLDSLPDSDAYDGSTGIKGWEIIYAYGIAKNLSVGLDCYLMQQINGPEQERSLWQLDFNYKF